MTRATYSLLFPLAIITCCFQAACAAEEPAKPTTSSSKTPTEAVHRLFQALDKSDRAATINCWSATAPGDAKQIELRSDTMLAVAKLKQSVRAKMGSAAQFELQMAIVSENENPAIEEKLDGDRATATVMTPGASPGSRSDEYSLIKKEGDWKVVLSDAEKQQGADADEKMAKKLVDIVNSAAKAVDAGQLKSPQEVLQRISDSLGSP